MGADDDLPNVFTPRSLADRWQCSERHVRNLIDSGELPAFRLGGKLIRIRRDAVTEFEGRPVEMTAALETPGTVVPAAPDHKRRPPAQRLDKGKPRGRSHS